MPYTIETVELFYAIGISVRTKNSENITTGDIGKLWGRFFDEGIPEKIPGKVSEEMMTVYTDYESDQDGAYTAVVCCPVGSLDDIPEGMVGITVPGGKFAVYQAEGIPPANIVATWEEIWEEKGYTRRYAADVDIFGAEAFDPENPCSTIRVSID